MRNAEIAAAFDELGDLYELDGAVVYRVIAYRNAAKAIRDSGASVEELSRAGRVTELPGVGKTIAEKITFLLDTGSIPSADKLKAKCPPGLVEGTGNRGGAGHGAARPPCLRAGGDRRQRTANGRDREGPRPGGHRQRRRGTGHRLLRAPAARRGAFVRARGSEGDNEQRHQRG